MLRKTITLPNFKNYEVVPYGSQKSCYTPETESQSGKLQKVHRTEHPSGQGDRPPQCPQAWTHRSSPNVRSRRSAHRQRVAELIDALRARYGADDIVSELLIDQIAVDHWRQKQGLEAEIKYVGRKEWSFHPQGSLPTIQRYNTANRRAMLKNLEILEERHTAQDSQPEHETAEYPDAGSGVENETATAEQEPSATPLDSADDERSYPSSLPPSPAQAGAPTPESDGNSPAALLLNRNCRMKLSRVKTLPMEVRLPDFAMPR